MEVDRQTLIKLLEAFAEASEALQRELMVHQLIFEGMCRTQNLNAEQRSRLLEGARTVTAQKIAELSSERYESILPKLPQIVDLLDTNRDEALRVLREWKPKGPLQ
jgi:hypothetical protein